MPGEINLLHVKRTAGRDAREVLPAVMAALLRGLAFPKRMSWDAWLEDGKGTFPFGRPIRWLVALLDGTVVPFTIFEAQGGREGPRRSSRAATRPTAIASCPRARPDVPCAVKSFARPPRAASRSSAWSSTPRSAKRSSRAQLAPVAGTGLARLRPARGMEAPRGMADRDVRPHPGGVPEAPDRGAADRPRPSPEVHPAGRRRARDALRGPDQRRPRRRGRRSCAAWSASWWRACATPRSSSPRT